MHTSFMWKHLHLLLPIKESIYRMDPKILSLCTLCNQIKIEDLLQTFQTCSFNNSACQALVKVLMDYMPSITMKQITRLNFDLAEDMKFSTVWFTVAFLLAIWERRASGSRIRMYEIRAEIEGKISLLRETSYSKHVGKLSCCVEILINC